jgi:hypothetical protein
MNVIVSNKYQALLGTLNIDVIKSINGEFEPIDLINQFTNFYYNRMILDITAIKNYEDINTIRQLSLNLDMSKVILVLDDSPKVNSASYLSQLVSMGIYNFTRNIDAIKFLIANPNTYKDVAKYQKLDGFTEEEIKEEQKNFNLKLEQRVIGFKNVTDHAGATTLVYMLKKQLETNYKVKALEINNNDFEYFNEEGLESVDFINASFTIQNYSDYEVILVDLNDGDETLCNEVIYLIEPGIIKLNKLIRNEPTIFDKLYNKKIVLNKSVLDDGDVTDFERESGSKVFFNMPCLDEKLDYNKKVNDLLIALGFSRMGKSSTGGNIFNIFG